MATHQAKKPRKGSRHQLQLTFPDDAATTAFKKRLDAVKEALKPQGSVALDNVGLMTRMLDIVDEHLVSSPGTTTGSAVAGPSFLQSAGIYTGDTTSDDQQLFVIERTAWSDLCTRLVQPCVCQSFGSWVVESTVQKGHVLRAKFRCQVCKQTKSWASSRIIGGHYLVNQRLVHGFTAAGILPSQYIHFSSFSRIGVVGQWYINKVYHQSHYADIVKEAAEASMCLAVNEAKETKGYADNGEWVITDARHDSTANAYHSTVPCLSGSTHRIVGISTLSRSEHSIAQTREYECTVEVIPQVQARGLNVTEVAHDFHLKIKNYIINTLHMKNSFDTWHGTKNVAKGLDKVTKGRGIDNIKAELRDKKASTKRHLYWCMKNCGESELELQSSIMNISKHYQGDHSHCYSASFCHNEAYQPSKVPLKDPAAIAVFEKALKDTMIYKHAQFYCRCRDTFWIESFNHQLLTYIPKRIHFHTSTFKMRMSLALMDWNENVGREVSSLRHYTDLKRPTRRTPKRILKAKSFSFVETIWSMYVRRNAVDTRPLDEDTDEEESEGEEWQDGDIVDDDDDDGDED